MTHKTILFIFLTICGCILHSAGVGWVLAFTPLYIIMSLLVLMRRSHLARKKQRNVLMAAGLIGFLSEVIGVQTGLLYGEYSYGTVLGPKIFDVALMLTVMWVFVPLATYSAVRYNGIYLPLIAGSIAVGYDYILEKFAINYNLWQWQGDTVPFLNYATWFMVTALIVALFVRVRLPKSDLLTARVVLCTHILFFGLLLLL